MCMSAAERREQKTQNLALGLEMAEEDTLCNDTSGFMWSLCCYRKTICEISHVVLSN